ncbi:MAG: CDP-alcohol phosphatidyltransferase family protein [Alphaproteobacteria bacterium]
MANLITLSRFLLLFVLVAMALKAPPAWQLVNAPLLVLIIALDGIDGYVARRRGETSSFGSVFDIMVDRIVENVICLVLAYLDLLPLWVAILFLTRGIVVDSIRYRAVAEGETVFGMMRSRWGRLLVAGRFARGLYGALKLVTFGWLFLIQPWPMLYPEFWSIWNTAIVTGGNVLVFATVIMCIARAVPVIIEYLWAEGIVTRPKMMREAR